MVGYKRRILERRGFFGSTDWQSFTLLQKKKKKNVNKLWKNFRIILSNEKHFEYLLKCIISSKDSDVQKSVCKGQGQHWVILGLSRGIKNMHDSVTEITDHHAIHKYRMKLFWNVIMEYFTNTYQSFNGQHQNREETGVERSSSMSFDHKRWCTTCQHHHQNLAPENHLQYQWCSQLSWLSYMKNSWNDNFNQWN